MSTVATKVAHMIQPSTRTADYGGFFAHHGIWAPGVRIFRALSFPVKALVISLAFLLPAVGITAWLLYTYSNDTEQARMDATRQHVEIAYGILSWAQSQETAGKMTREQAQSLAKEQIGRLRYDEKEYFWINDMEPRMVMHPIKPELNGRDIGDMKDPNGFALFKAMVETVRKNGKGLVSYQWPKPGSDKPVDKISYVRGFEPWGWIIGSGVYTDDLKQHVNRLVMWMLAVAVVASIVVSYLFFSFYRVMNGGLNETRRHLKAMTSGDLTTSPAPWGKDEAAHLMWDLLDMQNSLRGVVASVRSGSTEIVQSSAEIEGGAHDLSHRTEQAAFSIEKVSVSMKHMSAAGKSTAERTSEASLVARHNADIAMAGGKVMREVIQTMEGIRCSSSRIGEIISTIDEIAFQTNLLALNAAVEAARAGQHGRGFAVVASEVRSLAQRSAVAAKEIKALITESVDQVEAGAGIVNRASVTIEEIVATSENVDRLLSEVVNVAKKQSDTTAEIGAAVHDMDEMTQQNAALVEQTAAATTAMRDQATALSAEVSRFTLPQGNAAGPKPPVPIRNAVVAQVAKRQQQRRVS